jgi:hypothetical protein
LCRKRRQRWWREGKGRSGSKGAGRVVVVVVVVVVVFAAAAAKGGRREGGWLLLWLWLWLLWLWLWGGEKAEERTAPVSPIPSSRRPVVVVGGGGVGGVWVCLFVCLFVWLVGCEWMDGWMSRPSLRGGGLFCDVLLVLLVFVFLGGGFHTHTFIYLYLHVSTTSIHLQPTIWAEEGGEGVMR